MEKKNRTTFQNLPSEKRNKILDEATKAFAENGYAGASINTLVKRLGIAKGSIFQYFQNKKGLFLHVFDVALEQVKNELKGVREETREISVEERLRKVLQTGISFVTRHPILFRLYLRLMSDPDFPEKILLSSAIRKKSMKFLSDLVVDAKRRNEAASDIDPGAAAFVFDAVMDRFLQATQVEGIDGGLGIFQMDPGKRDLWVDKLVHILAASLDSGEKKRRPEKGMEKTVLIVSPTGKELSAIAGRFGLTPFSDSGEYPMVVNHLYNGVRILFAVIGIGPIRAACGVARLLAEYDAEMMLLCGIAGGFSEAGVEVGDVVIATHMIDPVLGRENPDGVVTPIILEGNSRQNPDPGDFPMNIDSVRIMEEVTATVLNNRAKIHFGPFLTVSTITRLPGTKDRLFSAHRPVAEEMEGFPSALLAAEHHVPFYCIRTVSNIVGETDRAAWEVDVALTKLAETVWQLLPGLLDRYAEM